MLLVRLVIFVKAKCTLALKRLRNPALKNRFSNCSFAKPEMWASVQCSNIQNPQTYLSCHEKVLHRQWFFVSFSLPHTHNYTHLTTIPGESKPWVDMVGGSMLFVREKPAPFLLLWMQFFLFFVQLDWLWFSCTHSFWDNVQFYVV